jgi:ParB family chromosome partitioning protein
MPKNDNRLPATNRSSNNRIGQNIVRSMISQRLSELEKEHNEEAYIVPLANIVANPDQPRKVLDPERDAELTADVAERGILEPLIVRSLEDGKYQIVAGERRYRAATNAGLEKVPVIVKNYNDEQARYVSIVENIQRQDLHELDEARFFQRLIDEHNVSVRDIADYIHRSHTYVQNRLKLLRNSQMGLELPDNFGEISHNRNEELQKLQKSQANAKPFSANKPIARFSSFLEEARTRLPELDDENKRELAKQIRDLKQQIAALEKDLSKE